MSKQKLNDLSLSISLPLLAVFPVAQVRKTHSTSGSSKPCQALRLLRIPACQSWIQILSDFHFHCADGETGLRVNINSNNNKMPVSLLSVTDDEKKIHINLTLAQRRSVDISN